jgi:hypothetical protein
VLTRPKDERATFLDEACGGDAALRRAVESLIAQPASADTVLGGVLGSHRFLDERRVPGSSGLAT